jgi:methylenetetrahydrofolate reductase (NADPH)
LASGYVHGLHMYTFNLEQSVVAILNECVLNGDCHLRRELPWRARLNGKEDVRPIFWANRPKSYMVRTNSWDEFPNGRWGDSRSPAYGVIPPQLQPKPCSNVLQVNSPRTTWSRRWTTRRR